MQRPIAHRGLHNATVPENSLMAFRYALNAGQGIECDVRILSDDTPVIFHDRTLTRLTKESGAIVTQTVDSLALVRLGESGEKIPQLQDVLHLVQGRVPLILELKTNPLRAVHDARIVADAVKDYSGTLILSSFSVRAVCFFTKKGFSSGQNFWHRTPFARTWSMLWWLARGRHGDILAVPLCYTQMAWMRIINRASEGTVIFWKAHTCERCASTPIKDAYVMFGSDAQ